MASVAPYPHIEMHVRDESIYIGLDTEILPLDRPIFMMRTQKGDIGKPIWCPSYTYACLKFGAETFNKRSKFWSEQSYFLLKTLVSNGAFIMRVAEEKAAEARVFLECGIRKFDVPQWQRNSITGLFTRNTDGSRVKINSANEPIGNVEGVEYGKLTADDIAAMDDKNVYATCVDKKVVVGKKYYARDYKSYKYTPYTKTSAEKDMVLYFGEEIAASGSGTDATPAVEATVEEYTTEQLTPEILKNNYLWRKATENDYTVDAVQPEDLTNENKFTSAAAQKFFKFDAESGEYTAVTAGEAFSDDETYYIKAEVDSFLPVTDLVNLDPAIKYYTITYPKFSGELFEKGQTIDEVHKYYTRTPVYVSGFKYVDVSTLIEDGKFVAGDRIESDNSIYHLNTQTGEYEFVGNEGTLYYVKGELKEGDYQPQATIPGYQIAWRTVIRSKRELEDRPYDSEAPSSSNGFDWYPVMYMEANSAGTWGNSYGFRFFYDGGSNTVAEIAKNLAVKYTIAPVELKEDDTTPSAIVDAYGNKCVVGCVRENVIDPTTDLEITLKKLIPGQYSGSRELPNSITIIPENFNVVGKMIMQAEIDAREAIGQLYGDCDFIPKDDAFHPQPEIFTDKLLAVKDDIESVEKAGHMANCVSCAGGDRVPYFASGIVGTYDEAEGAMSGIPSVTDLNSDSAFYLLGGTDGDISDYAIEKYQRDHIDACVNGTQDYLIDYLRCPYNSLIDTGVSLKTKKAYLDFMNVRDNLTVFLTPQQLWANQDGSYPKQLTRYEDESVGASLRSYGLLMREDIQEQTEANRCCIFLASGINSDHDYANDGLCASTLWIALKNAVYYNGTMIKQELGGRPNSEITCYDGGLTWTAASEETRSRCWNAGLNYAQYCEQNTIHYASVRSIYRYDTSVLCDIGTVRAVTFCKDIIRKEWTIHAGVKTPAEELNALIKKNLDNKITAMLNNHYTASTKVYQTEQDVKDGYVRHVELRLESPAQNRVWIATIVCRREGYDPSMSEG